MPTVWVLGSLNVDVVVRVRRHPAPGETVQGGDPEERFGGKGANQAMAAVAAGAAVRMVGVVGDDARGDRYRERLRSGGVDATALRTVPGPTGSAFIAVADDGENSIIVSPGANAAAGAPELAALDGLRPEDVLLVQLEVDHGLVADAVRRAAAVGARVVLNAAPWSALPADVLDAADPVVVNESEARLLAEAGLLPPRLLVTRGAAGASWDGVEVAAAPVDAVVDTTGAGDAYCGALAAALARGEDRESAMAAASALAARAVERLGAQAD